MNQQSHTKYVVFCITFLGTLCLFGGVLLAFKGYAGDLVIGGALAAISGLIGLLGNRSNSAASPDVTVSGNPPKVEVTQPEK